MHYTDLPPGIEDAILDVIRRTGTRPTAEHARALLPGDAENAAQIVSRLIEEGLVVPPSYNAFSPDNDISRSSFAGQALHGLKKILERFPGGDRDLANAYLTELARKESIERTVLAAHTTSYLAINVMLAVVWALTAGGTPWFIIPILGWGIGYLPIAP